MTTHDKSEEFAVERTVAKLVAHLARERDEWQAYLDAIPGGQARTGYAIGYRDALDAAIDDLTQRRWETDDE